MKQFVCLVLLIGLLFLSKDYCQKVKEDVTEIVIVDELPLDHGQTLKKGDYAQLVMSKSTEEGMFIRTKKDSSLVYYQYVTDVVFVITDMISKDLATNKEIKITKGTPLISNNIKSGYSYVKLGQYSFKINSKKITVHNPEFYKSIYK